MNWPWKCDTSIIGVVSADVCCLFDSLRAAISKHVTLEASQDTGFLSRVRHFRAGCLVSVFPDRGVWRRGGARSCSVSLRYVESSRREWVTIKPWPCSCCVLLVRSRDLTIASRTTDMPSLTKSVCFEVLASLGRHMDSKLTPTWTAGWSSYTELQKLRCVSKACSFVDTPYEVVSHHAHRRGSERSSQRKAECSRLLLRPRQTLPPDRGATGPPDLQTTGPPDHWIFGPPAAGAGVWRNWRGFTVPVN